MTRSPWKFEVMKICQFMQNLLKEVKFIIIYKATYNQTSLYYNLQSDRRIVPEHIPRPDYADHPQGFPLSEQKLKGNTYIRQLDADEIEGELMQ